MIVELSDRLNQVVFCYELLFSRQRGCGQTGRTCQMRESNRSHAGRSMIEMLGVLAIVGILSVGAIAGFGKAMTTHRLTTAATEYAGFIRDLTEFRDSWLRISRQSGGYAGLTPQVVNAGFLPKNWRYSGGRIVDSTLHTTTVTASNKYITVNYELKNKKAGGWTGVQLEEYCRLLFEHVALPYQDMLFRVWIHRYGEGEGSGSSGSFWGSGWCSGGRKCLQSVTFTDMQAFCQTCLDYENCTLVFTFE